MEGVTRTYRGVAGRLLYGRRLVTEFRQWSAAPRGGRFHVAVERHEPDPVWWDNCDRSRLVCELEIGRHVLRGPAEIESLDPLVCVVDGEEL